MVDRLCWSASYSAIEDILKYKSLPCLLRLEEGSETSNLPAGTIFRFCQEAELKYLHVRVMTYPDVEREYGKEFQVEHSEYVGKELLIPIGFKGKVKTTKRTFTVKQIIKYFPRNVTVQNAVMAINPSTKIPVLVPSRTFLHVDSVTRGCKTKNEPNHIICSDGKKSYAFPETQTTYFSTGCDRTCRLDEFADNSTWWQPFSFVNLDRKHVATLNDEQANETLVMLSGPLKPISIVGKLNVVGYGKKPDDIHPSCFVLVPRGKRLSQVVEVRVSLQEDKDYVAETLAKIPSAVDIKLLEEQLYSLFKEQHIPVFLSCSSMFKCDEEDKAASVKSGPKPPPKDYRRFAEKESPPPILPRMKPPVPPRDYEAFLIARRKTAVTSNYGHQHFGRQGSYPPPSSPSARTGRFSSKPRPCSEPNPETHGHEEDLQVPESVLLPIRSELEKQDWWKAVVRKSVSGFHKVHEQIIEIFDGKGKGKNKNRQQSEIFVLKKELKTSARKEDNENLPYREPVAPQTDATPEVSSVEQSSASRVKPKGTAPLPDLIKYTNASDDDQLMASKDEQPQSEDTTAVNQSEDVSEEEKPSPYSANSNLYSHAVEESNEPDFYSYTVQEVVECFRACALHNMATICEKGLLNGRFFKDCGESYWREPPFNMTGLEVTEIKHIIHDGWRTRLPSMKEHKSEYKQPSGEEVQRQACITGQTENVLPSPSAVSKQVVTEEVESEARWSEETGCLNPALFRQQLLEKGNKSRETTSLLQHICVRLGESLKPDKPKHVWSGYAMDNKTEPVLVAMMPKEPFPHVKTFETFEVVYRQVDQVSNEGREIVNMEMQNELAFTPEERSKLHDCLNKHSQILRAKHSNIEIISASKIRSRNYGKANSSTEEELCIVLYVPLKGIVPFHEDPFPSKLDEFPVDVREGHFKPFSDPCEYHQSLMMGCQIGSAYNKCGTLGGFVKLRNGNIGCLTCWHVFLSDQSQQDLTSGCFNDAIFQPGTCNPLHRFGKLIDHAHFSGDDNAIIGMDAALIEITDPLRLPQTGQFPEATKPLTGFSPQKPMVFNSGKVITNFQEVIRTGNIVKFGFRTGHTIGTLRLSGTSVDKCKYEYEVGSSNKYVLYQQFEVFTPKGSMHFSDSGDSGSLVFVVTDKGAEEYEITAVGMLVGGTSYDSAVVTPIWAILQRFGLPMELMSFQTSDQPNDPMQVEASRVGSDDRLGLLEQNVSSINSGIATLKQDVTSLRTDVSTISQNFQAMATQQNQMQEKLAQIVSIIQSKDRPNQ